MRIPGRSVDFVPPAKTDQSSSSDVFEVVKVGGEKEEGDDESENTVVNNVKGMHNGLEIKMTYNFPMNRNPKRYIKRLPVGVGLSSDGS